MRRSALVLAAALAACSRGENDGSKAASPQAGAAAQDDRVSCALAGAKAFAGDCTREIGHGPDGEVWIVRHPDGGFRRFVLIDKGTRIATADGAEEVRTERQGGALEVRVGADRYRFPAAAGDGSR